MNMIPRIDLDAVLAARRAIRSLPFAEDAKGLGYGTTEVLPIQDITKRRVRDVLKEVCLREGISRAEMLSYRRARPFIRARQEVYYRAAMETSASYAEIGRIMCRDHTTVMFGIGQHARRHNLKIPQGAQGKSRRNAAEPVETVGTTTSKYMKRRDVLE